MANALALFIFGVSFCRQNLNKAVAADPAGDNGWLPDSHFEALLVRAARRRVC